MNPTKLVSHFSDFSVIFCAIYKNQENGNTIGVTFCNKDPGKKLGFAMWPLGRPAGASCRNLASAGGGTRRERRGGGLGIARVRFGALVVAWRRPARVLGGALGWLPLERLLRRDRDQSAATGGGGGSCAL
jgi:hypothetical protein